MTLFSLESGKCAQRQYAHRDAGRRGGSASGASLRLTPPQEKAHAKSRTPNSMTNATSSPSGVAKTERVRERIDRQRSFAIPTFP